MLYRLKDLLKRLKGLPDASVSSQPLQTVSTPDSDTSQNLLGIDVRSLGSLKPRDLLNNRAHINTVLTYLRSCEVRISELETQNETLKTYPVTYEKNRMKSRIAQALSAIAIIPVGFGVNFLSSRQNDDQIIAGWVLLGVGILLEVISLILVFTEK